MRSKKLLTIVTGIITLVSFPLLFVILRGTVFYDIDLAIFGSATLGCIMAYSEYLVARREAMDEFFREFLKLRNELLKFPPIKVDFPLELFQKVLLEEWENEVSYALETKKETKAVDELIQWKLGSFQSNVSIEKDIKNQINKEIDLAKQTIHDYDRVISTETFKSSWERIDFFKKSYQRRVYEKLYKPLINIVNILEKRRIHLHFFNTGEARNLPVAFKYCIEDSNEIYTRSENDSQEKFLAQCEEKLSSQFDEELFDFWKKTYHPSKLQCEDEKRYISGKSHAIWSMEIWKWYKNN